MSKVTMTTDTYERMDTELVQLRHQVVALTAEFQSVRDAGSEAFNAQVEANVRLRAANAALTAELDTARQCNAANILELSRADERIGALTAERDELLARVECGMTSEEYEKSRKELWDQACRFEREANEARAELARCNDLYQAASARAEEHQRKNLELVGARNSIERERDQAEAELARCNDRLACLLRLLGPVELAYQQHLAEMARDTSNGPAFTTAPFMRFSSALIEAYPELRAELEKP